MPPISPPKKLGRGAIGAGAGAGWVSEREGLDGVEGIAGDEGREGAENDRDPRLPPPEARAHASALTSTRPRQAMRLVTASTF
jgi:hypothetical protein